MSDPRRVALPYSVCQHPDSAYPDTEITVQYDHAGSSLIRFLNAAPLIHGTTEVRDALRNLYTPGEWCDELSAWHLHRIAEIDPATRYRQDPETGVLEQVDP